MKLHLESIVLFFVISIVNQYDPSYTGISALREGRARFLSGLCKNYTVLSPTDTATTALHEVMHSLEHREKVGLAVNVLTLKSDSNNFAK